MTRRMPNDFEDFLVIIFVIALFLVLICLAIGTVVWLFDVIVLLKIFTGALIIVVLSIAGYKLVVRVKKIKLQDYEEKQNIKTYSELLNLKRKGRL